MGRIFVSHVEEDADVALRLVDGLEAAGYSTWTYERDAVPGVSYLLQTARQIEDAEAVVLVISRDALGSRQVTSEVIRAHESARPFIPVLVGISHVEFCARQPEWREALGSATSVAVANREVGPVLPRIVTGLQLMGVTPAAGRLQPETVSVGAASRTAGPTLPAVAPPSPAPPAASQRPGPTGSRRPLLLAIAAGAVMVAVVVAIVLALGGGDTEKAAQQPSAVESSQTTGPQGQDEPRETDSAVPVPADLEPAEGVRLSTPLGDLAVASAALAREVCPPWSTDAADCSTVPAGSDRYVVLTLDGAGLVGLTEAFNDEAYASWVTDAAGRRADPVQISLDTDADEVLVVYALLEDTAGADLLVLYWPETEPLRLTVP